MQLLCPQLYAESSVTAAEVPQHPEHALHSPSMLQSGSAFQNTYLIRSNSLRWLMRPCALWPYPPSSLI